MGILHIAAMGDFISKPVRIEPLKLILEANIPIDVRDQYGSTALATYLSFRNKKTMNLEVIRFFLDSGAEINSKNVDGGSQLLSAQQLSRQDVVDLPVEYGAVE